MIQPLSVLQLIMVINISQKRGHINWQVKAILPEDDVILMPTFLFFHMAIDMERTPSFHYFFFLFQIFRCVRSPVHTQCACMNTYVHIHCLIIPPFRLKPTTTQKKKNAGRLIQTTLFKMNDHHTNLFEMNIRVHIHIVQIIHTKNW